MHDYQNIYLNAHKGLHGKMPLFLTTNDLLTPSFVLPACLPALPRLYWLLLAVLSYTAPFTFSLSYTQGELSSPYLHFTAAWHNTTKQYVAN